MMYYSFSGKFDKPIMHVDYITENDYNLFCRKSGGKTFFHSTEWHGLLKAAYNIRILYLGLFSDDQVVGVIPIMSRKIFGLYIYGMPLPQLATPNDIFPLYNADIEPSEVLGTIDRWVKDKNWRHLQISWPADKKPLKHVREEIRSIVEIDISRPVEMLWQQIKREGRNRIRYAVHNKIRIHLCASNRYLDEYPRLLHFTYNVSQGIRPNISPSLLDEIRKRKAELPLKVFTATYNDKVVAMLWIFFDEDTCYFWEGASDATGKMLAANHLLHWEVIRWAQKQGIKRYDMAGGIGRGGKRDGILRFKQSLGARVRECKVLYWQPKWVQILFRAYRGYLYVKDRPRK